MPATLSKAIPTAASLSFPHIALRNAADVHEMFRRLGYDIAEPDPFEREELTQFEFDPTDAVSVQRVYIVAKRDMHTVYLIEVDDLRTARLRGLAWNVLQRGTALLAVTKDYHEIVFVDPRFVGSATKSSVRVNKLKLLVTDPTRHDLDTLNAIHAHRRTGSQIYDAQAEAFNVASVTRRFYDEYRVNYERVRTAAQQYNKGVREFQDADKADKLHAFAQRLLGRLMFIYFLQRKGWIGERTRFLTERYLGLIRRHADDISQPADTETFNFYTEVLTPLFFETFNKQRLGNITQWPGILIPYLNGGLFDPSRDPDGPIMLPDSLFDPHSSDGVLAFFNRYNFTVSEDTPLEQDVAVDPEMLGKVFENLLEERDRGQSGSFYTPRVIVAYMCQEALAGYLEERAEIPRDLTRAQFDPDSAEHFTPEQAVAVNRALDTLTVLDPAVGSGSFLIGMMGEIIRLRRACAAALDSAITPALLADWKEAIIRDTLYGVDIKPEAIEVAQLRLWLALVVDQTLDQARPLPNLDYKLMAGNSLIETIDGEPVLSAVSDAMLEKGDFSESGPVVLPAQQNLFGDPVQNRFAMFESEHAVQRERTALDTLRRAFFRAPPTDRPELRARIAAQERQIVYASLHEKSERAMQQIEVIGKKAALPGGLKKGEQARLTGLGTQLERLTMLERDLSNPAQPLPFFLYRLHFHEVFATRGGFDVVIANPPYVRMEMFKEQKAELEAAYADVYAGRADLFVYFFKRAVELLRANGQLAFITSNKYLKANYGAGLRHYLSTHIQLDRVIDFGDAPLFDAAAYPCILMGSKITANADHIVDGLSIRSVSAMDNLRATMRHAVKLPQQRLKRDVWQISEDSTAQLMQKLSINAKPLGEYVQGKFYRGVVTGLNDAFVIDSATRERLILESPASAEIIKPFLIGRDVKRWKIDASRQFIIFTPHGIDIACYPAVLKHLEPFKEALEKRATSANHAWYELQQPQMGIFPEFDKPKIVYPHFNASVCFAYDTSGAYSNDKTYFIPDGSLFLLGLLNSTAVHFFLKNTTPAVRGGYMEFRVIYLQKIPIPDAPPDLREKIAKLARQCLDTPDGDKRAVLETRLNALVYQAYQLNADEVRVIEAALGTNTSATDTIVESEVSQ